MALDKKVSFRIGGMTYAVLTDDSPEYLKSLASRLDSRISAIQERSGATLVQATTMAALEALDSAQKQKQNSDDLKAQLKTCLEDAAMAKSERDRLLREMKKGQISFK